MAKKKFHKSLMKGKIFIGKRERPVNVIKRSDIPKYMTDRFYALYDAWSYFMAGMGLPYGGSWADYPEFFVAGIRLMEMEYKTWL